MDQLRNLSPRPELLVDDAGNKVGQSASSASPIVGVPGPWGRNRVVFALPMGPVEVQSRLVVQDDSGFFLADAQGNLIGQDKIVVHRMLAARWTEDTRRLSGG